MNNGKPEAQCISDACRILKLSRRRINAYDIERAERIQTFAYADALVNERATESRRNLDAVEKAAGFLREVAGRRQSDTILATCQT